MQKYNSRADVPEEFKWDLTGFFATEDEFNRAFDKAVKLVSELKEYVGCTKDAKRVHEFLVKEVNAIAQWEDLYVYASLIDDQELGISENIARKDKTIKLNTELNSNMSFFAPELLKLNEKEYAQLFIEEPKLNEFKAFLDSVYREKKYVLSEREEKLISEFANIGSKYADMSSNLLSNEHNYGKVKLEDGSIVDIATNNYRRLMKNKDVVLRKKVYNSFNNVLNQYAGTSADLLNGYVSLNNTMAKIHHHDSAWSAKLFGLNLSNKVFESLINATEKNLKTLQKYYKLRKKVLGLKKLHFYDGHLEMAKSDKKYTILEAQELVRNAVKPLGEEYVTKFNKIIDNRYIDYCQYKGKCSGGYSFATLTKDSRILMSYNYDLDSVSTIAHESGHNVHHQFVNENNPLQYRDVSSLVAEVISLTNECLLSSYVVNNAKTKEEKLAGLNNIIGVIVSNLFGAVREGKMELDMYEHIQNGGTLTKEYLNELSANSLKKYYGNVITFDKFAGNGWITRSHYYMNFYLFSYAICVSIACSVASKIISGDQEMLTKYYEYMKTGSDKWPIETFAILGIDVESEEVYEEAIAYFDSLLDTFEKIYDEEE